MDKSAMIGMIIFICLILEFCRGIYSAEKELRQIMNVMDIKGGLSKKQNKKRNAEKMLKILQIKIRKKLKRGGK